MAVAAALQGLCRVQSASSFLPSFHPPCLPASGALSSSFRNLRLSDNWHFSQLEAPPWPPPPPPAQQQRHPSIKRLIDPAGFRRGRSELFSPREAQQLWTVMIKGARAARPSPRPPAALLPSAASRPRRPLLNYLRVSRGEPSCINSVRSPCLLEVAVYIAVAPLPGAAEGRKEGGRALSGRGFIWLEHI